MLFIVLFGLIDFARALYTENVITSDARWATRYAMVRGTSCIKPGCPATAASIQDYVRNLNTVAIDSANLSVDTTWPVGPGCDGTAKPSCPVVVKVSYPFQFVRSIEATSTTITATSHMTISQ